MSAAFFPSICQHRSLHMLSGHEIDSTHDQGAPSCIHRFGLAYPQAEDARPVLRSDNGKVLTSKAFTACSKQYGLAQEFITPYTPQQNGMIERFFRSLKEECIWLHNFETYEQAKEIIEEWVCFYHTQRPHQSLGYLSPAEHRAQ